ncbi:hypothetical protein H6P81_017588 [Aristolochia fimbriata]|uniref:AT3G52170-like helix-turn-helix domain-containing protein n=1 Tax=Aristolochia fimbriata TaxID=158543 RepID=A0AAV7DZM0_ARIFI|nr:hypothetical protein H6P81_017588 [Aristolochia fimbriata]
MVEVFVKKYQASNNGNFPSLNLTHKEVGGSFYTVREIVREIIQENRVLGPASPISENENVVKYLESPLSLSPLCGSAVTFSQEDVTFLPDEDSATDTSLGRIHKIVEQQSVGAHANHSDHHVVSEPGEHNNGTSVNHGIDQPVSGLPNLINNHKVVEEITIPDDAVEDDLRDLTSNTTVKVWDPNSDAEGIHYSNRMFAKAQGLTGAPEAKQANDIDANIEDLSVCNGKATISLSDADVTVGFLSTEISQSVESESPSMSDDQDWQAAGAKIEAAPQESQLQNTLVDAASTPNDLLSSVFKQKELVGVEADKNVITDEEKCSVLDDKISGFSEKSPNVPEVEVANPFLKVIKSWITSVIKFWLE